MILFDTNIFIEIYRDNIEIIGKVEVIGQHNIVVSDVTCAELLYGARNKREIVAIRKDLNQLSIAPIEATISTLAVELIEAYALSHKLSLPDVLIAATSLIHDIELYTLNSKDFRYIKGLKLYSRN